MTTLWQSWQAACAQLDVDPDASLVAMAQVGVSTTWRLAVHAVREQVAQDPTTGAPDEWRHWREGGPDMTEAGDRALEAVEVTDLGGNLQVTVHDISGEVSSRYLAADVFCREAGALVIQGGRIGALEILAPGTWRKARGELR